MHVIADFSLTPIGVGTSLSDHIAACVRVLDAAGLKHVTHAHGTNVEGGWDKVFAAIKRCHEVVHEMGAPRISTSVTVATRTDRFETTEEKVESVEKKLEPEVSAAAAAACEIHDARATTKESPRITITNPPLRSDPFGMGLEQEKGECS